MTNQTCSRPTCERIASYGKRGLCTTHYRYVTKQAPAVPAPVVAAHIGKLRAAGLPVVRIHEMTGVPMNVLKRMERQKTALRATADKILAIPVPVQPFRAGVPDGAQIDGTGTQRRLQSLTRIGYHSAFLAQEIGCKRRRLLWLRVNASFATAGEARRVAELFARLHLFEPTDSVLARQSRRHAEQHGWPLPLAWDEETIDDPNAEPYSGTDESDFADIMADHRELGRDDLEVARILGLKFDTLRRRLYRAGIPTYDSVQVAS